MRIESVSELIGLTSTTQTQRLDNLMREADHFAAEANAPLIERTHVEMALDAHRRRHESLRRRYQEEILRGHWLVDTAGLHTGQINGLAVVPLSEAVSRIRCTSPRQSAWAKAK